MLTALAVAAVIGIVTQDQAQLRSAPRESAQLQVALWEGDSLEIRGERLGYLQVYDHRRERAGYIRSTQVHVQSLQAKDAPELLAVVRFLRDQAGQEALGIGYAAAYLKAAAAEDIGPEPFDAIGQMADRLAQRASSNKSKSMTADVVSAAHLEVVANYGVKMQSFERDGRVQLCYDGESFRRVLAMNSSPEQRATAALSLTRPECIDPNLRVTDKFSLDNWRAEVLDRVETKDLPEYLKNRIRLRRAGVSASVAFQRTRKNEASREAGVSAAASVAASISAQQVAERAIEDLAAIDKAELTEADAVAYTDAALRVSASRWAASALPLPKAAPGLSIVTSPGQPGETCISLVDAKHDQQTPLFKRCTFSLVWAASARSNASGTALALAVQPMETWRELWVFHQTSDGWTVDVLPPALTAPELGYIEFAGWVPGKNKMLVAREAKVDGRFKRSFQVVSMESYITEKQADKPGALSVFYRWQDAAWERQTLALR